MAVLKVKIGEDEFKVAAGAVFLGLNQRNPADIVSIGLGQRNSHTKFSPDRWGPIGGFIEEGESIKEGLMREIKEEIGLEDATVAENEKMYKWIEEELDSEVAIAARKYSLFKGDVLDPSALIPISVNVGWKSGIIYFTYAYFYYFDVTDEEQAQIDNKPQILPKHLHPTIIKSSAMVPVDVNKQGIRRLTQPFIRGLGFIDFGDYPELQAFGNFGLDELWESHHGTQSIGTHADIIKVIPENNWEPSEVVIHPAAMDVPSLVLHESFVPGVLDNVDRLHAVWRESSKWKSAFQQMQDIFEIGITENCLNWELLGPDQFGGTAGLRDVSRMHTHFYEANLAARTFLQSLARPSIFEIGGTGLLGVLKEGLSGRDPNFSEFTILPETCGFTDEEVIEWARKNKFGNKWWYFLSDKYLEAFELSKNMGVKSRRALMKTGTQESLPTPYLLFTQSEVSGPHYSHSKNIHAEEMQQELAKVVFPNLIHTGNDSHH